MQTELNTYPTTFPYRVVRLKRSAIGRYRSSSPAIEAFGSRPRPLSGCSASQLWCCCGRMNGCERQDGFARFLLVICGAYEFLCLFR